MADDQVARRPVKDVLREHGVRSAVATVSLREVLAGGKDPLEVVAYQQGMGREVSTLEDLYECISGDGLEDELAAFPVALGPGPGESGLLVCQSSDDRWQLYVD
jgi:hypothetical protein